MTSWMKKAIIGITSSLIAIVTVVSMTSHAAPQALKSQVYNAGMTTITAKPETNGFPSKVEPGKFADITATGEGRFVYANQFNDQCIVQYSGTDMRAINPSSQSGTCKVDNGLLVIRLGS